MILLRDIFFEIVFLNSKYRKLKLQNKCAFCSKFSLRLILNLCTIVY